MPATDTLPLSLCRLKPVELTEPETFSLTAIFAVPEIQATASQISDVCRGFVITGAHVAQSLPLSRAGIRMRTTLKHTEGPMSTVVIVLLVLLLVGALPSWPYSSGWGYYPSGGLGLVLLIVLILALTGRL